MSNAKHSLPAPRAVQDGEPVSKMAEEYMSKGKAMLEDKKAGFEAHKV